MSRILLLLVITVSFTFPAQGQTYTLSDENVMSPSNIVSSLEYFETTECELNINSFLTDSNFEFFPLNEEFIRLSHADHVCHWFKISFINHSFSEDLILRCNDTYIRRIDAFVVNNGKVDQEFKGGLGDSFGDRRIPYRMTAFPLTIPRNEQRDLIIKIENQWDNAQLSMVIMDRAKFEELVSRENLIIGGAAGFIILMIIISLFLWIIVKRRLFGFYFLYATLLLVFFLTAIGVDYQYFISDFPRLAHDSKLLASCLGITSMYLLIVQYFIEQGSIANFRQWHSKVVLTIFSISMIAFSFQYELTSSKILQSYEFLAFVPRALPLQIIALILLYILVSQTIKNPIWTNILFLFGFLGWLSNAFVIVLTNQSLISPEMMPYQFYTIGLLIEAIAVSIIMATVILKMRSEKLELDFALKSSKLENQQAAKLRELDSAKSRFYTNITHEFRTPLTVIKGLTDQVEGNDDKKELIQRNSNILLRLINQLLDISKADKGELELRLIQDDVIKYLHYLCESYKSWGASKNIRFHFLPKVSSLLMDFDPERLQQVVGNLISNAIKNTDTGGDIYFFIKLEQGLLSIIVKDTGAGIHPESLKNIFDRFYQDESSANNQFGSGIGLALVKELVTIMNGQISVTSELGQGSEFTILLPVTNKAKLTEVQEVLDGNTSIDLPINTVLDDNYKISPISVNGDKDTILVVEDNADVRHYISLCLADSFAVLNAENGQKGVEKALAEIPDLIISDVMMPEKNGLELCEELKTNILTSHIPIILLTAKADQEAKVQGLMRGADAYLAKPFDKEELIVRVASLTEQRRRIQKHYLTGSNQVKGKTYELENQFLSNIRQIIIKELTNAQFDVQRLAREVGMSRSQLYRKVKALTGRSIANYIRYIRLQEGKKMLETTTKTISEVAYDVGFSDLPYFSNSFSEEFGYPPNATRK